MGGLMVSIDKGANYVRVNREITILNHDTFLDSLLEADFRNPFCLDMGRIKYIDSTGIGSLISLERYYDERNIRFALILSPSLKTIFHKCRLDRHFQVVDRHDQMEADGESSGARLFYDVFTPETSSVGKMVDRLLQDLKECDLGDELVDEIVVAMDEAFTNAMLETVKTTGEMLDTYAIDPVSQTKKSITVIWEITHSAFSATIIDRGSGLSLEEVLAASPDPHDEHYVEQLADHQEKNRVSVRVNGRPIEVKRLGAGMKIIMTYMDSLEIDLIDTETGLSGEKRALTVGTILNMQKHFA